MVRIDIEQDADGFFYATSPDLKGLVVSEPTMPILISHVGHAITDMHQARPVDSI